MNEGIILAVLFLGFPFLVGIAVWRLVMDIIQHQRQKRLETDMEFVRKELRLLCKRLDPSEIAKDTTGSGAVVKAAGESVPSPIPKAAASEPVPPDKQPAGRGEAVPGPLRPIVKKRVASRPVPPVLPVPPSIRPSAAPQAPGAVQGAFDRFERAAAEVCRRVFNWIIVGEEYRDPSKTVEFAVATTWGVRIGISIFVAGVLFGLKLSFDYGIIGPSGRVALGLLVGAGMLVGGVKLLGRKAQLLGLGLMGGGLATLYATSFAAHQMYEIVNSWTAFGMMGAVTLVAGLLAIRFSSLLVAVLGIIGGYATPFVLSGNADAGYISFFAYLLLLGAGILLICRYRDWPLLNYLGLGFCMVHVLTTLDGRYGSAPFAQVMPMLVLLFLLYSTVMVLHNIVARKSCTLIELGGLTANSAVFFGVSQALIRAQFSSEAIAILTIGLAVFYIGLVFILMKRGLLDRGLLLSLITLGSFYVCMTMPLLLSREWLTASWAVQALLMLWLSRRTGSRFLQALSYVVFGIMLFRLGVFDLPRTYPWRPDRVPSVAAYLPDMLQHILTFGIPIAALAWACRLHALPAKSATGGLGEGNDIPRLVPDSGAVMAFLVLATLVGFIFSTCETNLFMRHFVPNLRVGAISILWALFALSWIVFGISRDFRKLRLCGLGLFAVVACKVVLVDLEGLGAVYRMVALMIMGVIILGGSFIYLRNAEKFSRGKEEE